MPHQNNMDQMMEHIELEKRLEIIKYKIIVLSGKGGVGKSTVAANLALSLALGGKTVGLLDVDFHGPSIPKIMGVENRRPEMNNDKIVPIQFNSNLKLISLGSLVQNRDAVIWRGPMKMGAIQQLIKDVEWGELDYLIFDCPPGTGDEPLSIVQLVKNPTGALVVTTPQSLSTLDVFRSIKFCEKVNLPIIGVIENMSGFICPHCNKSVDIFKSGGGEQMAKEMNVPFLGKIPIETKIVDSGDDGQPFIAYYGKTEAAQSFEAITDKIVRQVEK